jgi:hypothetical protein
MGHGFRTVRPDHSPATVGGLRSMGLRAVVVCCLSPDCPRTLARIEFDMLGLPAALENRLGNRYRENRYIDISDHRTAANPEWWLF